MPRAIAVSVPNILPGNLPGPAGRVFMEPFMPPAEHGEGLADVANSRSAAFPVVGIGASAGGLEALSQLLERLSSDCGVAVVIVQHLGATHESQLAELLGRSSALPVVEAADGLTVEADHVYVITPNTSLRLQNGRLAVGPRREGDGPHLPVDGFLKSLADDAGSAAIGVILSGTGLDGTLGLEQVKAAGGITFAQDDTAKHAGMPHSAIRSGCVDYVLPPAEIATELCRIASHPYMGGGTATIRETKDHFRSVLSLLATSFGVDFSEYRDSTIRRRISRRLVLHTKDNLADYVELLRRDRAELEALYHDILIGVTSFFREPEAFDALKEIVLPAIASRRNANTPIRIWVPGCSTGQEAYSIAMVLAEYFENQAVRPPVQIFATDLSDSVSLHKARAGIYPETIEAEVPAARLRRFFTKEHDHYRVNKAIRDTVVFARQNLVSDPPFSRLDLISCRNLLIYLSPKLQKRVIPMFHYALNPGAYLCLGHAETIGSFTDLFDVVDSQHRIYVRKTATARQYPHFRTTMETGGLALQRTVPEPGVASSEWQREADRVALGTYVPPGVLVNENLDVLQFRGDTGAYLSPASGEPSLNLLKFARPGLFLPIRSAVREAQKSDSPVRRRAVRIRGEGHESLVHLHVVPIQIRHLDERCFLVLFEQGEHAGVPPAPESPEPPEAIAEIDELRKELISTREYLQSVIEQQDAANEELKSANEEILSSNEELQSTNEELETAKEELQSVNEELTTVNEQLQNRNVEMTRLNDDLTNLLASSNVAIVVLAADLRIRRFTAAAGKMLGLVAGDAGRALGKIRLPLEVHDLEALVAGVMDSVQPLEREVRDERGHWYAMEIRPYRTLDNRIDGAVMVLADIHAAKVATAEVRDARDYAEAVVETARSALVVLGPDMRIRSANKAFDQMFHRGSGGAAGHNLFELDDGQWNVPRLRTLLEAILPERKTMEDFELSHAFRPDEPRDLVLNARRLAGTEGKPDLILLAIEDQTDRTRAERVVMESEARLRGIIEALPAAVYATDARGRVTMANEAAQKMGGIAAGESSGSWSAAHSLYHADGTPLAFADSPMAVALTTGQPVAESEIIIQRPDGERRHIIPYPMPLLDEAGVVTGAVNLLVDITERKQAEETLRAAEARFRGMVQQTNAGLAQTDLTGRFAFVNERYCEITGRTREALLDLRMQDITYKDDLPANLEQFQALVAGDKDDFIIEKRYVRPDGSVVWVNNSVSVILGAEGQPRFVLAACIDVTERRLAEEALKEADRRKDEFLAMLAHELRNPLAPIRNALQILRLTPDRPAESPADVAERSPAAIIERQVDQLVRLVDDLLEASRMNRGRIDLRKSRVELARVLRIAVESVRPMCGEMDHEIAVTVPAEPLHLMADPNRLAQIVGNLLTNACKYTGAGGRIDLEARVEDGEGEETSVAIISVRDTGIGLAPDQLERIFDMFAQVDTSLERSRGGLGIGLTLVRNLVELHGGTVAAESAGVGQGSTFTVRIPIADGESVEPSGDPHPSMEGKAERVLVVDDNRDAAESLSMLLELRGYETRVAYDGPSAIEQAAAFRPDVIFLDIGLPGLSGYETARRIRSTDWGKGMSLVALTGWGQAEDRRKSRDAGFDAHVVKPVDLDTLARMLVEIRKP